jgi:hypothetical protein
MELEKDKMLISQDPYDKIVVQENFFIIFDEQVLQILKNNTEISSIISTVSNLSFIPEKRDVFCKLVKSWFNRNKVNNGWIHIEQSAVIFDEDD